ncbi:MAG: hypothetical protein JWM59_102 [Verrucomicrobiales bacterium]|nr:hypothetical protein [Verrucomicrobiales bacterium]
MIMPSISDLIKNVFNRPELNGGDIKFKIF